MTKNTPLTFEEFCTKKKLHELFETRTCKRCGGCGKFSFNLMHGDICYGCGGTGWQYTPKGKRQLNTYQARGKTPASEIKIGDLIKVPDMRVMCCVTGIEETSWQSNKGPVMGVKLITAACTYILPLDAMVGKGRTTEKQYADYLAALAA